MSNQHESNQSPNNNRRRPRRQHRRDGILTFFHDREIGPEDQRQNTVARYFISTKKDESPEIFLVLMNREIIERDDGKLVPKSLYEGNIEMNAIPISQIDLDQLYRALVDMKSRLERQKTEYLAVHRPEALHTIRPVNRVQVEPQAVPEEEEVAVDPQPNPLADFRW